MNLNKLIFGTVGKGPSFKIGKRIDEGWKTHIDDFNGIKNAIAPSYVEEHLDYIQFDNNFARTLVVIGYPSSVKAGWLSELYRFNGNISISMHIVPSPAADKVVNSIGKSVDKYEVKLAGALNAEERAKTKLQRDSAEEMLKKLTNGKNDTIFLEHMYIHLQAEGLEELNTLTSDVEIELRNAGLKSMIPRNNMLKAFQSCLPAVDNMLPEYTFQNMDAEAVSSTFAFDESEICEEDGMIEGINKQTRTPVIIDKYGLKNHNEFIVGASGGGKTFKVKVSILRHFMLGYRVFIIDPLGEYEDVVTSNNGQYITISNKTDHVINPLQTMDISQLMVFFKLIKTDLTPLEEALIEDCVMETYERNPKRKMKWDDDFSKIPSEDFPTLGDLMVIIREKEDTRLQDFIAILKSYVEGSKKRMFNGITRVNLKSDIICFSLKELKDESQAQKAAYFSILTFLWDTISKDDTKPQRLFVDEASKLCHPDNPRAMKFLYYIYKQCRHFKCGTTAATQQVADYLSAVEGSINYGKSIIGNSQSKLILGLEPTDIKDIEAYNVLKLSEKEKGILLKARKGEGIFIAANNRVHMQVEASPEELKLIDPIQYKEKYGGV